MSYPTNTSASDVWTIRDVYKARAGDSWPGILIGTNGSLYADSYLATTGGSLITVTSSGSINSVIDSANNGDAILLAPGTYNIDAQVVTSNFSDPFRNKNVLICGDTNLVNDVVLTVDHDGESGVRDHGIFVGNLSSSTPSINRQTAFLTYVRQQTSGTNYVSSLVRINGDPKPKGRMVNCYFDNNGGDISWHYDNAGSTGTDVEFIRCTFANTNLATLDSSLNSGLTLSNGNLTFFSDSSNRDTCMTNAVLSSGKWYWELTVTQNRIAIGIEPDGYVPQPDSRIGWDSAGYSWWLDRTNLYHDGSNVNGSYGGSVSAGDIIGVALDLDNGTLEFFKNGTSQGVAFTGISGSYVPAVSDCANVGEAEGTLNFGQNNFIYTPPSGFIGRVTGPWDNSYTGRDDQIDVGNCLFSGSTQTDEYVDLGGNVTSAAIDETNRTYDTSTYSSAGHLYVPNTNADATTPTVSSDISNLFDVAVFLDPQGSDSNDGLSQTSPVQTISRAYTVVQNNTSGSEQVLIYFEDGSYTTNENESTSTGSTANTCDLPNFQALGECHFMSRNPGGATINWVKDVGRDSFFQHDHKAQNQLHFIGLKIVGDTNGTDWSGNYQMALITDGRYGDHSTEGVGNDIITFNNCLITTQDPSQYGYSYGYFNGPTYSYYYGSLRFNHCLFDMPSAEQYTNNTGGWECGHIGSGVSGSTIEAWPTIPSGYNNMDTMTTGATTSILNNGDYDWSSYPQNQSSFIFP